MSEVEKQPIWQTWLEEIGSGVTDVIRRGINSIDFDDDDLVLENEPQAYNPNYAQPYQQQPVMPGQQPVKIFGYTPVEIALGSVVVVVGISILKKLL